MQSPTEQYGERVGSCGGIEVVGGEGRGKGERGKGRKGGRGKGEGEITCFLSFLILFHTN